MYLSDHSKDLLSADEKIAELRKQRDKLEAQLTAEREKVRVLRSALERLYADTIYHHDYVDEALAATEDKP